MTIERQHGKVTFVCNTCNMPLKKSSNGREIWHDKNDFDILRDDAYKQGWTIDKNPKTGEWEHTCFDCID